MRKEELDLTPIKHLRELLKRCGRDARARIHFGGSSSFSDLQSLSQDLLKAVLVAVGCSYRTKHHLSVSVVHFIFTTFSHREHYRCLTDR